MSSSADEVTAVSVVKCGCAIRPDGSRMKTCETHRAILAADGTVVPPNRSGPALNVASASVGILRSLEGRAKLQPAPPTERPPVDVRGLLGQSGVLLEYLDARLDLHAPALTDVLAPFFAGAVPGVLIKGLWGSGKTHLAVAIFAEVLKRRNALSGVVVLARTLRRQIVESYRDDRRERTEDVIQHYVQRRFLVIDDLGHEGAPTEAFVGDLHEILTRRRGMELPTVITTNIGLRELGKLYDGSIESRLTAYTQIQLSGDDRRRRKPSA